MSDNLIKTKEELKAMRDGGKILAEIMKLLIPEVVEGNTSIEVDKYANFLCKRFKVRPSFLGYNGFKHTICSNLNEVVVHGFANNRKFKSGDIFGLDMGIVYQGFHLDTSVTICIGSVSDEVKDFVDKTKCSMMNGIDAAVPGNRVGDISFAMRKGLVGPKFTLMRDFVGHGIGKHLHEKPDIPGDGMDPGEGILIKEGMVLAIESISVLGPTNAYEIDPHDEWTVYTKDKRYLSALWEHTLIVTNNGPEIIT